MLLRWRWACAVFFAAAVGSTEAAAQAAPAGPGEPQSSVTVIGCVQRQQKAEVLGLKSPSGFVLMNVSNSPFGGGLPNDPQAPAATAGTEQQAGTDRQPRSGDPRPAPSGGASVSPGLTYLLDGKNIEPHAGQRVEVRGTLHATPAKLPLTKRPERGGAPAGLPQRLVVQSMRTLAKDCSR